MCVENNACFFCSLLTTFSFQMFFFNQMRQWSTFPLVFHCVPIFLSFEWWCAFVLFFVVVLNRLWWNICENLVGVVLVVVGSNQAFSVGCSLILLAQSHRGFSPRESQGFLKTCGKMCEIFSIFGSYLNDVDLLRGGSMGSLSPL